MTNQSACPVCGYLNYVGNKMLGQKHRCSRCGTLFAVPTPAECPFCGRSNQLTHFAKDLVYKCQYCGEAFEIELDDHTEFSPDKILKSILSSPNERFYLLPSCLFPLRFFLPLFLPLSFQKPSPRIEMWGAVTAFVLISTVGHTLLNAGARGDEVGHTGVWLLLLLYSMLCLIACGWRRGIDSDLLEDVGKVGAFSILAGFAIILVIPGILYMFWVILKLLVYPSKPLH